MIPDRDAGARPPLTLEFAFVLALLAPLVHMICVTVLLLIGFRGTVPVVGMATVLAYGGMFTLCAARFREPPLQQLALVRAPATAWLAVAFLAASVLLTSEIDNLVKAAFPPPLELTAAGEAPETPPFWGMMFAVVQIAVFPLAYGLFFRGILQPLAVARLGLGLGIVLSALMSGVASGLIFGGVWGVAPAFANSLVLALLRQASRSLWPSIALHALTGVITMGALYELFGIAGFDDTTAAHTPLVWLLGAGVLTGIGLALLRATARGESDPAAPPGA